jgi:ABC-type transport system substrate-binding protein
MTEKQLSRRRFLKRAALAASGAALVACQPKTVVVKETVQVEVEKEVTKVVEVEKEVTKVVKETVVVEKEVAPKDEMSDVQELRIQASFFGGDIAIMTPGRRGPWAFNSLLWAPLVAGDTAGEPMMDKSLAEGWDVSDDGTVYTFYLREQARFSDGTPITAHHVAGTFGYYTMLSHNEARGYRGNFGPGRRLYWDVVGLMDMAADSDYEEFGLLIPPGVEALDDHTVQITLEKPSTNFIARLTVGFAVANHEDILAAKGTEFDLNDYWPAHTVYSGPYMMVESVPGDRVAMAPNPEYFGPKPTISKITLFQAGGLTQFENKELDLLAYGVGGEDARQAFSDPYLKSTMVKIPSWIVMQFWMTPNEPLDDVHVRRALSMAINREALVKILNAGSDVELYGMVNMHRNPNVPNCEEETAAVTMLPFDPATAKEELAKSKYGAAAANMEIHIDGSNQTMLPICEAIQLMLQENLGMTKVTVHTEAIPNRMDPPYPLHLWPNSQMPWYPDVADTLNNMTRLMGDKEWEPADPRAHVSTAFEPELRDIITEALNESDMERRCELVQQAGQMWNDVAFSLDYALPVYYMLIQPWVKGFEWYQNINQAKPLNIEDVWVAKH